MLDLHNLNVQLSNLKSAFDHAIIHGSSFDEVKKIYLHIKEVERLIEERKAELDEAIL